VFGAYFLSLGCSGVLKLTVQVGSCSWQSQT